MSAGCLAQPCTVRRAMARGFTRDTGTPLIRIGFPVFDRHHHHRYPVWGYQGGMNVLVKILDKIFDEIDKNTSVPAKTDYSFDIIR